MTPGRHPSRASAADRGEAPLRVLWIVDSLATAEREGRVVPFAEALDHGRVHLDVLVLSDRENGGLEYELRRHSVPVHRLRARGHRNLRAFLRLRRRLLDESYDLVHTHGPWAAHWGGVAARLAGVPLIATLYGDDPGYGDVGGDGASAPDPQGARATKALRRWARRVVTLSAAHRDHCIREGIFSRTLLDVIPQGVPVQMFPTPREEDGLRLRREAGFPAGGPVAVTVASMDEWESGVDVLLWAVPTIIQEVPQARFVIAGEGKLKKELQRRMRARGLNRVIHWPDDGADIPRVLSGGDLFIHPSLRDPFPTEALEAMAAGLPLVAARVGGVPEIVGSADVGRLFARSDPDALAREVVGLFREPDALEGMGEAARKRAREHYSARRWAERMEQLYGAVTEEVRRGVPPREWSYARLNVELLGRRPVSV